MSNNFFTRPWRGIDFTTLIIANTNRRTVNVIDFGKFIAMARVYAIGQLLMDLHSLYWNSDLIGLCLTWAQQHVEHFETDGNLPKT